MIIKKGEKETLGIEDSTMKRTKASGTTDHHLRKGTVEVNLREKTDQEDLMRIIEVKGNSKLEDLTMINLVIDLEAQGGSAMKISKALKIKEKDLLIEDLTILINTINLIIISIIKDLEVITFIKYIIFCSKNV